MVAWGKDPFGAALSLIELCGPVVFSHFSDRVPVGKKHPAPWIQVAAVARDQTKNTFTLFPTMISVELQQDFGLSIFKEIIHKSGGGRIEAVTSSARSLEGGRSHFVLMNETQFWMDNNQGKDMAEAIAGNTAKGRIENPFRRLAICNAHRPGEESVAEDDHEFFRDIQSGSSLATKFFYDAVEAPADTILGDPNSLRHGITCARGDSVWLDVERLMEEVYDKRTTTSEARRKYLNQVVSAEDAWVTKEMWLRSQNTQLKLRPGDRITLGFDGSYGNDHTALMACRVEDGALFLLGAWNPKSQPGGKISRRAVDIAVRKAFELYDVVSFRADVKEFESYIDTWEQDYSRALKTKATPGHWIAYDMRSKSKREFPLDCESFRTGVEEGIVKHDGNAILKQHVLNARERVTNDGLVGIGKDSKFSPRKIDAAVTAVLAFSARQQYIKDHGTGKTEVGIF